MYTLQASTELMKSHKAAQVLADQSAFQVLQTSAGQSLFFSIGDSNVLYLSAEQDNVKTGWTPIDLTTELNALFPGRTLRASAFGVSQNPADGTILIVQAVHVVEDKTDHLFVLGSLSDAPDAAWLQSPGARRWAERPFDAPNPPSAVDIAYVHIEASQDAVHTPYVVVGLRSPATQYVQNYLVDVRPQTTCSIWTLLETAENYDTLLDISLGMPAGAMIAGLYALYSLNGTTALLFTPLKGRFGPPNPTKLTPPAGASSLAVLPAGNDGSTNLYVAGTGGIYLFAAGAQTNFATGALVLKSGLIADVEYLEVHQAGGELILWGRNNSGTVFCSRCADASRQAEADAWSSPIPLLAGVGQLAAMLDRTTGSSVLYAHTSGANLVELAQDAVTTQWRTQSILLPQLSTNDVVEFYTYTTHVSVLDENLLPVGNQEVPITATSPGTVYLNDSYVTVSPSVALTATAGPDGTFTLVQQTQTLGAICYRLTQGDGTPLNVNPMSATVQRMSGINTGADLRAVTVTDEKGNTTPLVAARVPTTQSDAVAQALAQFLKTAGTLPQDGSLQQTSGGARMFDETQDQIWGLDFTNGDIRYFNGLPAMAAMGVHRRGSAIALHTSTLKVDDIGDALEAFAGDIFQWLEGAIQAVDKFFVQVVGDVTHFFIQLGEQLYHFVMRCVNDVVHAIQFILNKIEVAFEQLVQWLGFIFSWKDIVRTHKVLKNIIKQYALKCVGNVGTYRAALKEAFTNIEDLVNAAAGLPPIPDTAGQHSYQGKRPKGIDSPQAHYGSYHARSNGASATTNYEPTLPESDPIKAVLDDFYQMLEREKDTFTQAYQQLKTQVVDPYPTLTVNQVIDRLLAIIFDVMMESIENAMLTVVDVIAALLQDVVEMLDAPIDIPVLSWLYKKVSGDDLTILDLGCLILAIPVTVIAKLANHGQAPFPDDRFTSALISAPDYATIQRLYQGAQSRTPLMTDSAHTQLQTLQLASGVCGYFGAIGVAAFGGAKWAFSDAPIKALYVLYAVSYLAYVMPNVPAGMDPDTKDKWYTIMNDAVTGVSVLKTFVDVSLCKLTPNSGPVLMAWDQVSPAMEAIIGGVWEVPVIAGLVHDDHSAPSIVGFIGNTIFNIGGLITPGTYYCKADVDPVSIARKDGFFAATVVCTVLYGMLAGMQGFLYYNPQSDLHPALS